MTDVSVHPSADVHPSVELGESSKVWANSHIRENAIIGRNVTIGEGVYVGPGVIIGDNSKIQNLAQIYDPAVIGKGVFVGPGVILTNDRFPRAVSSSGEILGMGSWDRVAVRINDGASIGAGVICVAPIEIGEWSLVAAGSVVVSDVLPHAFLVGAPARFKGWVGKKGVPLEVAEDNLYVCPNSGEQYYVDETGRLRVR